MRRLKTTKRWLSALLALLLMFDPVLVPILSAQTAVQSGQTVEEKPFDADSFTNDRIPPGEYLKALLETRGANLKELEDRACAEWLLVIANCYSMMGAAEADVPVFYATLDQVQKKVAEARSIVLAPVKPLNKITEYAESLNFVCSLARGKISGWGKRVLDGWEACSGNAKKLITEGIEATSGLKYGKVMNVAKWISTPAAGEESTAYFRWLGNKTGLSQTQDVISNTQGICHSVGIGLDVLGFALSTYSFCSSEDFEGGRLNSYSQVKIGADAILGLAGLVCMFIPGGQLVTLVTLIWTAVTKIGDELGELNKKWQEAYKNSFNYLLEEDAEFRSFYDNRHYLKDDEKAASLKLAQEKFQKMTTQSQGATAYIGGNQGATASVGGTSLSTKQKELYEALERQGTLASYYYHTGCTVPDSDIESLKKLWSAKAGFMSWKPQSNEKSKPWWQVDPVKEAIQQGKNWLGSIKYENLKKDAEDKPIRRVWFNPDYVLLAKFLNHYMMTNEKSDLDEIIGLRIEQAPFNYLPLVEIGAANWSEALLTEAFGADVFCVGMKEMIYLREQMKLAKDSFDEGMEDAFKPFGDVRLDIARLKAHAEALEMLAKDYEEDKDKVFDKWFTRWGESFAGCMNTSGVPGMTPTLPEKMTPAKFIAKNKEELEKNLALASNHTAQCIVDLINIGMTIKSSRDTAALAEAVKTGRQVVLDTIGTRFQNSAIKGFLEKGEMPGKGNDTLNWLSDIYPPRDDLDKYVKLYKGDIDEYKQKIDKATKRNGRSLRELMSDYKERLLAFKVLTEAFEKIAAETDFTIHIPSTDTGVFDDTFDFVADFDKPIFLPLPDSSGSVGGGGGGGGGSGW